MPSGGPVHGQACVFARALLAREAGCRQAGRVSIGERESVECASPPAHMNCETLAALMHERARFALRLPRAGAPLMHAQAMRLQCGGLAGLAQALRAEASDVHALVVLAQARHGGLAELPWDALVAAMRAWQPRRRRRAP
jgi:hypothetical protein